MLRESARRDSHQSRGVTWQGLPETKSKGRFRTRVIFNIGERLILAERRFKLNTDELRTDRQMFGSRIEILRVLFGRGSAIDSTK